jgi:hypothetical protein
MVVTKSDKTVFLSQSEYVRKLLIGFQMIDFKSASTPCRMNQRPNTEAENQLVSVTSLGSINFLAGNTRPDILYTISKAAQRCNAPNQRDLQDLQRVLHYVATTIDQGITYKHNSALQLQCYEDASHNSYLDGKGHLGMLFTLGDNDAAFYAKSQKMKLVTLSSNETEYVALCEASTELVFLRQLLRA